MNLAYLAPRVIRHFMPESLADWMKKRKVIIKAGIETSDPQAAAQRYLRYFEQEKIHIKNKTVLIFGYGGNITTACEILKAGAKKVILCERKGLPYPTLDVTIQEKYPDYFQHDQSGVHANGSALTIMHEDIRLLARQAGLEQVDLVISSSVFEHLDDVDGITHALRQITKTGGNHFHFVDLRDHYFKYPFEMLTFSSRTWKHWLNPTSNLNRLRMHHYLAIFERYFSSVTIRVIESDNAAFLKTKPHIKNEFVSGDDRLDAATIITIKATA